MELQWNNHNAYACTYGELGLHRAMCARAYVILYYTIYYTTILYCMRTCARDCGAAVELAVELTVELAVHVELLGHVSIIWCARAGRALCLQCVYCAYFVSTSFAMSRPLDLKLFIPVVCNEVGKYAGKRYLERISSVRMLNGSPVEKNLEKSEFKTGDTVSIRFEGKDFVGTVDFGENEESLNEQGDSPCTVKSLSCETAEQQDSSCPKRKKRYRSWEGFNVQNDTPTKKTNVDEYRPKRKQATRDSRDTRLVTGKGKGKARKTGKV